MTRGCRRGSLVRCRLITIVSGRFAGVRQIEGFDLTAGVRVLNDIAILSAPLDKPITLPNCART